MGAAARALASLVLVLVVAMIPLYSTVRGDSGVSVRLVKASCRSMPNGTTLVNIMLQLPNPGYKLERKNITISGSSATLRLWFEAPRGPVIQVISLWGLTEKIESNISKIKIIINNRTIYDGECSTLHPQNEEKQAGKSTQQPSNSTNMQNSEESGTSETMKHQGEKRTAGITTLLGIALAGALIALLARR